ncbi:MAG: thiamine pyrophosphate-dependent dehydrogenase E1 component subunit alpha [Candidatus Dormibacteraeota bacterium]|uniref:2-oxoisovalerate dehydrogenase subunit alpha n=1 Tax=Candidatus Amunia macphersoniae TaxID=3127014 RepID=A0A934KQM4_9BACT|nr:thiamine pyrophosphate-dependent dehydrogenase E1 component subunit alpha [Candidatus Dormibacteraeota bacterium]
MAVVKPDFANREGLDVETLRAMYRHMLRSRVLDERMWVLNRQGRAPFWISAMGHEAIQVAVGMNMDPARDWLAPYYRDLALTLVMGMTPRDHLLSALAKAEDPNSGGRQMPAHYGSRTHNIISTGSPVTTQFLHAAGIALAMRIRGEDAVCVTAIGEGGTSGGDFHEALNFAATHKLGVVFVVENNGYAISVPLEKQMPTPNVSDRAVAYGIPGVHVDGNDAIACYRSARDAVARARSGAGPTLLEAKVHRLTSHSSDDDQRRYRSAEDLEAERKQDCLPRFRTLLEDLEVLAPGDYDTMRAELVAELDEATAYAEAAPDPLPDTAMRYVHAEDA